MEQTAVGEGRQERSVTTEAIGKKISKRSELWKLFQGEH
jgi:hypothetical protein